MRVWTCIQLVHMVPHVPFRMIFPYCRPGHQSARACMKMHREYHELQSKWCAASVNDAVTFAQCTWHEVAGRAPVRNVTYGTLKPCRAVRIRPSLARSIDRSLEHNNKVTT